MANEDYKDKVRRLTELDDQLLDLKANREVLLENIKEHSPLTVGQRVTYKSYERGPEMMAEVASVFFVPPTEYQDKNGTKDRRSLIGGVWGARLIPLKKDGTPHAGRQSVTLGRYGVSVCSVIPLEDGQ